MTTSSSRKAGRGEAGHIRGEGPKTSEASLDSTGDVKWAPRNVGARFGGFVQRAEQVSRIAPPLFLRSTIFSQSTPSHHRGYHCWTDERSPPVETCGRFGGRLGLNAVHVRVDPALPTISTPLGRLMEIAFSIVQRKVLSPKLTSMISTPSSNGSLP